MAKKTVASLHEGSKAVSYTHLDVYKRQTINISKDAISIGRHGDINIQSLYGISGKQCISGTIHLSLIHICNP